MMSDEELMSAVQGVVDAEARRVHAEEAGKVRAELAVTLPRVRETIAKAERIAALRAAQGKPLSARNREVLGWLVEDLERLRALLVDGAVA